MATQHCAAMQSYNSELMKCVEELKVTRNNIQSQIEAEEEEKNNLQKEVERMTYRIGQLNESLTKKAAARTDYDRTIQETESAYTKILESSQLLLNMVKREATCLDQTLHAVQERAGS
ncbi:microtubule nucleation factor SSNA1-like [Neodiprion pinetum]|uniref:Sjoegren syndrome nuclear autoantigen 1 homolog n=1 Tax=Neodiprion lecontei TaxID=441921 RepID=A0A6J0BR08_NEOLC|nr:Sjoegren syndrome nuclear autoantigen 1 homolog [Neodiprion lecontei]XP_046411392.1 Sjoegren syndrome nuclear autoantigen 1 homolog [Neodiprion fabricii]XP_046468131.1 Sjoegren syndrome nuclear autoantigen 1 homolog [Neodiprion pinetum]XP_046604833.1 Sjoegren syndrome nuclear autoantigen 1 homolog [Neodiprion virginianus]